MGQELHRTESFKFGAGFVCSALAPTPEQTQRGTLGATRCGFLKRTRSPEIWVLVSLGLSSPRQKGGRGLAGP